MNSTEELKISVPHYEGPLDLLLDLIRRQKIDIYDIPIARITEQYLNHLHMMQEMNVEMASEFLVMAAQLIYIKSRTLLPPDPDAPAEEQEDPRAELVRRLVEYEKFRNAAQMLYQREMLENASWTNPGDFGLDAAECEPEMKTTLFDLVAAFREIVKRAEQQRLMMVTREEFSVEQMMGYLWEKLASASVSVSLTELVAHVTSRNGLITAFLAMLELTKLHAIFLSQDQAFGEIMARANPKYELFENFRPA